MTQVSRYEYQKEWKAKNPDRVRETRRAWRALNPEKCRQYGKDRNRISSQKGQIRRLYGITLEGYWLIFNSQRGLCKICQKPALGVLGRRPPLDHNHETGEIRGILCHGCNTAIGILYENVETMKSMIEYVMMSGRI